jgi:hypothetical protein
MESGGFFGKDVESQGRNVEYQGKDVESHKKHAVEPMKRYRYPYGDGEGGI